MNPFWAFSLALYQQPDVAPACLALQDDHGLDVNLLLFACYCAAQGQALSTANARVVDDGIAAWRDGLVGPVRALRRRARDEFGEVDVRDALLAAELAAERVQQNRMWELAGSLDLDAGSGEVGAVLRGNLAAIATVASVEPQTLESFAALVEGVLPLAVA